MSEEAARRYASAVGMDEGEDGDGDEDPGRRSDRLRRRRRMLLVGGPPAAIVVVLAVWLAFLSLMTMAANNAVIHKDYRTAVSRYAISFVEARPVSCSPRELGAPQDQS